MKQVGEQVDLSNAEKEVMPLRPKCPGCNEPWLRPTQLAGRYRCVNCFRRYELLSNCLTCGSHSTLVRMTTTANLFCGECGESMLQLI